MFGSFGWMELLLILIIVLIIFGAGKIPQFGEGLGKAIKGFKKTVHEPDSSEALLPSDQAEQLMEDTGQENRHNVSESSKHVTQDYSGQTIPESLPR